MVAMIILIIIMSSVTAILLRSLHNNNIPNVIRSMILIGNHIEKLYYTNKYEQVEYDTKNIHIQSEIKTKDNGLVLIEYYAIQLDNSALLYNRRFFLMDYELETE